MNQKLIWISSFFSLLFFANSCAAYSIVDLGAYGATNIIVHDVNNSGEIAGDTYNMHTRKYFSYIMYSTGGVTNLGTFDRFSPMHAKSINNYGEVVGNFSTTSGQRSMFLYQDGMLQDLGVSGDAVEINDSGQVIMNVNDHAYLYQDKSITELSLGGAVNNVTGINSSGQVVGNFDNGNGSQAVIYDNGNVTEIGGAGSDYSVAKDINDAGQVVGYTNQNAFLYDHGIMSDLGVVAGKDYSVPLAINNSGQVVGRAYSNGFGSSPVSFLYKNGEMFDLCDLTNCLESGWSSLNVGGINDNGIIVGMGRLNREDHVFLISTVPLPETFWLFISGVSAILGMAGFRKSVS